MKARRAGQAGPRKHFVAHLRRHSTNSFRKHGRFEDLERLMHGGASLTFRDAILRHRKEAEQAAQRFRRLGQGDQEALFEFLRSL